MNLLWTADTLMYQDISMVAAYSGSTLIWLKGRKTDYLTFNVVSAGTIGWKYDNNPKTIYYSLNNGNWTTWTPSNTTDGNTINVSVGDVVRVKGTNNCYARVVPVVLSDQTYYDVYPDNMFTTTAVFDITGDVTSLLYGDDLYYYTDLTSIGAFAYLFSGATGVRNVELMDMPAPTLTQDCYAYMFKGCTSLTKAPVLASTSLAERCYEYMFSDCTSLSDMPVLPATSLNDYCYSYMFEGCSSLTGVTASLSATTLAPACYEGMFSKCTSLITAPALPATSLRMYCYSEMFSECTSLTTAPALPATTLIRSCYSYMFYKCSSLTTAPVLSAETLVTDCYEGMFRLCSSLNYIKCLATTISTANTNGWVYGVSSAGTFVHSQFVNWTIGDDGIPTTWVKHGEYDLIPMTFKITSGGIINWYHRRTLTGDVGNLTIQYRKNGGTWTSITSSTNGVSFNVSSGDVVEFRGDNTRYASLPLSYNTFSGTTAIFEAYGNTMSLVNSTGYTEVTALTEQYAFNRLFAGCVGLTTAEYLVLPSETIPMHVYSSTFEGCSSMTTAPMLPAKTLTNSCYNEMFSGCAALSKIRCLATDVSAYNCTYNWVNGVSVNGTFIKNASMSGWGSGAAGIPTGWVVTDF